MKYMTHIMTVIVMSQLMIGCGTQSSQTYNENALQDIQLVAADSAGTVMLEKKPEEDISKIKELKEPEFNTEDYDRIVENPFLSVTQQPLSTFSIDVDEAAYSNVRRYIHEGSLPPKGAVRIEEMINYFDYDYPQPTDAPFAVATEMSECPWK